MEAKKDLKRRPARKGEILDFNKREKERENEREKERKTKKRQGGTKNERDNEKVCVRE